MSQRLGDSVERIEVLRSRHRQITRAIHALEELERLHLRRGRFALSCSSVLESERLRKSERTIDAA